MLKNKFIKSLEKYNNGKSLYYEIISYMINIFLDFKDSYIFDLEGDDRSISISIDNKGLFLFIDLNEETLNIRFLYSEFFFFINEININELKVIIDDFFHGKYIQKSFFDNEFVIKQELLFNNQNLKKYNQVDIYSKKESNKIIETVGYNWTM